jgi:tetratricopeptide (TPR) repeat protein
MVIASPTTAIALAIDAAELARLEAVAADDAASTVALAWHLRERDTARALVMADAAEAALPADALALRARLCMVRGQAACLRAELDTAEALSLRAQAEMLRADDRAGLADAKVLQAMIAMERGDRAAVPVHLAQAHAQAAAGGDAVRARAAQAMAAFVMHFGDVDEAERQWGAAMTALQTSPHSVLAMWAWDYRGGIEYRRGNSVQAIAARHEVYHHAVAAGQLRRAIAATLNIGVTYHNLHDNTAALHWIEQGLQLARPTGWPAAIGAGLQLLSGVFDELGRWQAARDAADEACRLLLPLANSINGRLALFQACHVATRMGDHETAAAGLAQLLRHFEADNDAEMLQKSRLELAPVLAHLGQYQEALAEIEKALQLAQADRSTVAEIDALGVAAEVHAIIAQGSPGTATADGPSPRLPLLLRAIELAAAVPDFVTPASTWDQLAAEHAHLGDHAQAYAAARRAGAARDRAQEHEAGNRATALAAQLETERLRLEREQLREQAARSAERASVLQATHATLEQLGRIGREVTAMLDIDTVWHSIHGRLQALMDVPHLSLWLLDEATQTLCMRLGIEDGQRLPSARVALQSAGSKLARCLREDREIEHVSPPAAADHRHPPRSARMHNGLFGPLRVRGRVVGVMSVQSRRADAYGERERLVFRTVCAYGAIALDNAAVYAELSRARLHLQHASEAETRARQRADHAASQKNEFLIHTSDALRTPLGALHEALSMLLTPALQADGAQRRHCLDAALAQSRQVNVLARELLELARLESGAAQPTPERFSLADLTQDVLQKFEAQAAERQQQLQSHVGADVPDVLADIGMIERVLSTLIDTALRSAPVQEGVQVRVQTMASTVCVTVGVVGALPSAPKPLPSRAADNSDVALAIARQMLLLHGQALTQHIVGSAFEFSLPRVPP